MEHSITVLLPDGRLIFAKLPSTAALSGSALIAKYAFGDQVTIDCKFISPVWDQAANLTQTLELETIQFLRRPEPKELNRAIQSPNWRRPGNLLHPPPDQVAAQVAPLPATLPSHSTGASGDPVAMLELARRANLARAADMPNFVADEEASCSVQSVEHSVEKPDWRRTAIVRSEVTFKGMNETRQQVGPDGTPVPEQDVAKGCIGWSGGFGAYLKPLFDPKCGATLTFSKRMGAPGKQSFVYDFKTPPENLCFSPSFSGFEMTYPAHEGSMLIDSATGSLISVVARSRDFPKAYPIMGIEETVVWDFVKIGGEPHLLPVSYEKVMLIPNAGAQRVSAIYTNHRHFDAHSGVTFQ